MLLLVFFFNGTVAVDIVHLTVDFPCKHKGGNMGNERYTHVRPNSNVINFSRFNLTDIRSFVGVTFNSQSM